MRIRACNDDRCTADKQWQRLLHGEKNALNVAVECIKELLFSDRAERQHRTPPALANRTSMWPFMRLYCLEQPVDIFLLGRIRLDGGCIGPDRRDGCVEFGLAPAREEDKRAFCRERFGRC